MYDYNTVVAKSDVQKEYLTKYALNDPTSLIKLPKYDRMV